MSGQCYAGGTKVNKTGQRISIFDHDVGTRLKKKERKMAPVYRALDPESRQRPE